MGPFRRAINLVLALALTGGSAFSLIYLVFLCARISAVDAGDERRDAIRRALLDLGGLHQRRPKTGITKALAWYQQEGWERLKSGSP
jgi:hypothetical protein